MSKQKSSSHKPSSHNTLRAAKQHKTQNTQTADKTPVMILIAGAVILLIAAGVLFISRNPGTKVASAPTVSAGTNGSETVALASEISVQEAARLRESGAFILDVREPSEWVEAHLEGATLIPLGELQSRLNEVPRDQQVVVMCRSGNRSQTGRDILKSAGFTSVTSMAGGIRAWQSSGYQTISGE